MKNILRFFLALWYLIGWILHVYLAFARPHIYAAFGNTALFPPFRTLWANIVMPNIRLFALLLAAFELVTGVLLISKGLWVRIGLVLSMPFNLFLVQLGLAMPATNAWNDFLHNRLPNLLFIVLQIPLLRSDFERSIPEIVLEKLHLPMEKSSGLDS